MNHEENISEFTIAPLRVALVKEQDTTRARVRVVFPDCDQMRSYWLPVVVPKTQNDKAYWIPDIGEQVICLMDARYEAGVVLGAIYSSADAVPVDDANKWHLAFSDGASIEYDRGEHRLSIAFSDGASITYDGGAHSMTLSFQDGATLAYDAAQHALAFTGLANASATIAAPAGITLASGSSVVQISPGGVSVSPPLPTTSTVAQT